MSEQSRKKNRPNPGALARKGESVSEREGEGEAMKPGGYGACWRFVAKVKWRPAANLHFMCQFLHFLPSYQREQSRRKWWGEGQQNEWVDPSVSVRHAGGPSWRQYYPFKLAAKAFTLHSHCCGDS